ncbi:MAG: ABC transporter substrate-binding protein [Firmicutes bacterium]|nr:ABC transporter substrate-binding protein [Bacillota bacterium]
MRNRILVSMAVVFSFAWLLVSGTVMAQTAPDIPRSETLIVAQGGDAMTLDPQKQGKMIDMSILSNVFDMLLTRDENLKLQPSLTTAWKTVNDTTWQFTLRKGVKFHNGEPFNADAAKFSIERLIDPNTKSPIVELRYVKRVEIVNEYTINIVTSEPDPILPAKLTLFGGVMVPPKYIKERGDAYFAEHPVGTGPFKFVEWVRDDHVTLVANPDYWKGAPKVKKLVFRAIPDDAARVAALLAGDVDIISNLPPDLAPVVNMSPGVKVLSIPGLRAHFLSLDSRKGPLADKRVRLAIASAIDVDALIAKILGGQAKRLNTLVPEEMFGFDPTVKPVPYDPQKAKELLAAAGYPHGFDIALNATSGIYMKDRDIALAVSGQLAKVGIRTKVQILEYGTFLTNLKADKLAPIYFIGNLAWTLDATNNFQSYLKSDRRYARMKSAEVDKLVDIEETSMDPSEREKAMFRIQQMIRDDAYFVGLFTGNDLYGISDTVKWAGPRNQVLWMYNAEIVH